VRGIVPSGISLPRRTLRLCLAEELRRLDPDEVFGDTVRSLGTSTVYRGCQVESIGRLKERDRSALIAV
jgi:hypothetical protein